MTEMKILCRSYDYGPSGNYFKKGSGNWTDRKKEWKETGDSREGRKGNKPCIFLYGPLQVCKPATAVNYTSPHLYFILISMLRLFPEQDLNEQIKNCNMRWCSMCRWCLTENDDVQVSGTLTSCQPSLLYIIATYPSFFTNRSYLFPQYTKSFVVLVHVISCVIKHHAAYYSQ